MEIFILLLMIFLHIFDDFYLQRQGALVFMKQKSWWEEQDGYNEKYSKDYIVALICHAFSWAFMMMLPVFIWYLYFKLDIYELIALFFINVAIHAWIDHNKANLKSINLVEDQITHLVQIFLTWFGVIYLN